MSEVRKMEDEVEMISDTVNHWSGFITNTVNKYMEVYPAETTNSEVLDAVTVAIPLKCFVSMAAACALIQELFNSKKETKE